MDGSGGVRRGARGAAEEPLSNVTGPLAGTVTPVGRYRIALQTLMHGWIDGATVSIHRTPEARTNGCFALHARSKDDPVRWSGTGIPGHAKLQVPKLPI